MHWEQSTNGILDKMEKLRRSALSVAAESSR